MNSYDKRLIERLRNWEKVYPEIVQDIHALERVIDFYGH